MWGPKRHELPPSRSSAHARAVFKKRGVEIDDSLVKTPGRLLALSEQGAGAELYQPMLLLGLAIIGSPLIAIAVRRKTPVPPTEDGSDDDVRQRRQRRLPRNRGSWPWSEAARLLTRILDRAPNGRVEIAEVYNVYTTRCRQESREPATPDQFAEHTKRFCEHVGIGSAPEPICAALAARGQGTAGWIEVANHSNAVTCALGAAPPPNCASRRATSARMRDRVYLVGNT